MTSVMPWERPGSKIDDRHLQRLAVVSIPSQRGDDLCGQSLGEGGSVVTFVVDRALEPAHAV